MARPKPEKPSGYNTNKPKSTQRKQHKLEIRGWFTDDVFDDIDIGAWMTRRVDGETRKGNRRGQRTNSDPRSAPPFNRFLWSSKSYCKAMENPSLFVQESLHETFLKSVQVRLKKDHNKTTDQKGTKPNEVSITRTATCSDYTNVNKRNSASSTENRSPKEQSKSDVDDTQLCQTVPNGDHITNEKDHDDVETEVTRLKRLIAIARRHRRQSEVSDETGDSGVSLNSLKHYLSDLDGVWAIEYINNDLENRECEPINGTHSVQPVRFSYTQGNGICSSINDNTTSQPFDSKHSCTGNEPTPFVTTLWNYKGNYEDNNGIKPVVRSLKSANYKQREMLKRASNEQIPETCSSSDNNLCLQQDNELRNADNVAESETSVSQNNTECATGLAVDNIKILIPSKGSNLSVTQSLQNYFNPSNPVSVIVQKLQENGLQTTLYPHPMLQPGMVSQSSSSVFPIGDILPVVEDSLVKSRKLQGQISGHQTLSEFHVTDSADITYSDLLMHRGDGATPQRGKQVFLLKNQSKTLGPPPFRPMPNKTPLHRAREITQKRIFGHSFTQETHDLYQKLLSAKNVVADPKPVTSSARKRYEAGNITASRSAGNLRSRQRRPLGHTVSDTEFQEERAKLSARIPDYRDVFVQS